MKILKFGGTSVANAESLQSVISIVKSQKQKTVVVVSALGGITNLLIDLLEQMAKEFRDMAFSLQEGEVSVTRLKLTLNRSIRLTELIK